MNAINIPKILLPKSADMTKWAVNACDQFTSDISYWRQVERLTADSVSALNLIYPEIYLNENQSERILSINETMRKYLSNGVFKEIEGGFILVERTTESGTRTGIVLAIDLEDYSYKAGAQSLIRSTEATILERIPPRVEIRKNAPLELPHVMLLYNDRQNAVLNCVERGETLYDFNLNMNGGRVKGVFVKNAEKVIQKFYSLVTEENGMLFAVGDGNHSLATAKTCWEEIKKTLSKEQLKTHPARYALVEAVNIFDPALNFEPIHRLVKTKNKEKFLSLLKCEGKGFAFVTSNGEKTRINFNLNVPEGIRALDNFISQFIAENGGEVDYIHGEEEIVSLAKEFGVGIILPPIQKGDFFKLIQEGGNLPRKTFSMGEGNEKRYYIEAKAIKL